MHCKSLSNMELVQRFGDGKSVFQFFKDKGGKLNHLPLSVKTQDTFCIKLVFENGSEIPREELVSKGRARADVALLEIIVNGEETPYLNGDGEEVLSKQVFRGDRDILFRIMHVSRRHLDRKFRLQFVGSKGEVLQQTVPILVRSKLKNFQTYPENSSGPSGPQKRRNTIAQRPQKKRKVVDKFNEFVPVDMFDNLLKNFIQMNRQLTTVSKTVAGLAQRLDMLDALRSNDLIDPEMLQYIL